jgi:hypothetical protein
VHDYKGYRFPPEIISHVVWLSFRFSLSFRDSEEMMAQRGGIVTSETLRQWCLKFGQTYANALKKRRGKLGDTWHLDEVFLLPQREDPLPLTISNHKDIVCVQGNTVPFYRPDSSRGMR